MNHDSLMIMIIEDDLVIANNLQENLEELGYRVTDIARNWAAAKRIFKRSIPDLCLVDIDLKGSEKNGIEIMQALKAGDLLPIIYLTALDDKEVREKAKLTNPSAYLIKPASKRQIDVAIDFAMANFHRRAESPTVSNTLQCPFIKSVGYYFVKVGSRYQKLYVKDISHMQAAGSSCCIYLSQRKIVVSASLQSVLEQFSEPEIVRCHRSWAININCIDSFDDHDIYMACADLIVSVPVSKGYKESLQNYLPRIKAE